jgi:hypothetical protein
MRVLMGVIKDRHGTYYARKTVPAKPEGLRTAVACELNKGKAAQSDLKKSLGTKDAREANVRAKPVLMDFDRIIARARARLAESAAPLVKRSSLSDIEIKRMAEYLYADTLARDARYRATGREELKRQYAEAVRLHGHLDPPHVPHDEWPVYGLRRQVYEDNKEAALRYPAPSQAEGCDG